MEEKNDIERQDLAGLEVLLSPVCRQQEKQWPPEEMGYRALVAGALSSDRGFRVRRKLRWRRRNWPTVDRKAQKDVSIVVVISQICHHLAPTSRAVILSLAGVEGLLRTVR